MSKKYFFLLILMVIVLGGYLFIKNNIATERYTRVEKFLVGTGVSKLENCRGVSNSRTWACNFSFDGDFNALAQTLGLDLPKVYNQEDMEMLKGRTPDLIKAEGIFYAGELYNGLDPCDFTARVAAGDWWAANQFGAKGYQEGSRFHGYSSGGVIYNEQSKSGCLVLGIGYS